MYSRTDHRCACTLHAVYMRLQTHTQNMLYFLPFQCNNGCTNTPQYYVTRALPVVLDTELKRTKVKVKIKQSHYRPRQDLGVPGG
jgi:hypothetical protein